MYLFAVMGPISTPLVEAARSARTGAQRGGGTHMISLCYYMIPHIARRTPSDKRVPLHSPSSAFSVISFRRAI